MPNDTSNTHIQSMSMQRVHSSPPGKGCRWSEPSIPSPPPLFFSSSSLLLLLLFLLINLSFLPVSPGRQIDVPEVKEPLVKKKRPPPLLHPLPLPPPPPPLFISSTHTRSPSARAAEQRKPWDVCSFLIPLLSSVTWCNAAGRLTGNLKHHLCCCVGFCLVKLRLNNELFLFLPPAVDGVGPNQMKHERSCWEKQERFRRRFFF